MQKFSFHESTVTKFIFNNDQVVIDLEDVSYNTSSVRVRIEVEGVLKIMIDSIPSDIISMPAIDGEVISLKIDREKLSVLIEWTNFVERYSFMHFYDIIGEKVKVAVM